jgi:hypothetical protein
MGENSELVHLLLNTSIITLNVNSLNKPIRVRQKWRKNRNQIYAVNRKLTSSIITFAG